MITSRLHRIVALSIPLFLAHALEEYATKFYERDAWDEFFLAQFTRSPEEATIVFLLTQITLVLVLFGFVLLPMSERLRFWLFGVIGLLYVYEFIHVLKALAYGAYYPGLFTAALFVPIALLFWEEWLDKLRSA